MIKLSELRWKCRRGMKELDVLLQTYLERYYQESNKAQQEAFLKVLDIQDPELYFIILGKSEPSDTTLLPIIDKLRHVSHY